jgi:hypothetical protein
MNPVRLFPCWLACTVALAACASQPVAVGQSSSGPPLVSAREGAPSTQRDTSSIPAAATNDAGAPPRGAVDPHVHDPVTADELGISEELGVVRTDAGGCGACSNAATLGAEARAAIVAIARRSRHCYGVARIAEPHLGGTIRVDMTIGAKGDVCSAVVRAATMHSRALEDCVEKLFREARGIPGISACVRVEVPLKFDDGEVQPETPK